MHIFPPITQSCTACALHMCYIKFPHNVTYLKFQFSVIQNMSRTLSVRSGHWLCSESLSAFPFRHFLATLLPRLRTVLTKLLAQPVSPHDVLHADFPFLLQVSDGTVWILHAPFYVPHSGSAKWTPVVRGATVFCHIWQSCQKQLHWIQFPHYHPKFTPEPNFFMQSAG